MWAVEVIESDPFCDAGTSLLDVLVCSQIDLFVLQTSPQAFDENVVQEAALAVHADCHLSVLKDFGEVIAGELRTLIGVEYLGLAVHKGIFQCFRTEACFHRVREPPGQYEPAVPIDDGDQVQKTLSHWDVGYVCRPDLVRVVDRNAAQQVRVDLIFW